MTGKTMREKIAEGIKVDRQAMAEWLESVRSHAFYGGLGQFTFHSRNIGLLRRGLAPWEAK